MLHQTRDDEEEKSMEEQSGIDAKSLNCHFNWPIKENSEYDGRKVSAKRLEVKILADIKNNPPIAVNAYLLLAYSFSAVDRNNVDFAKSTSYIERASEKAQDLADEYLVQANRFCIMKSKGSEEATSDILNEIKEKEAFLTKQHIAKILVSKGYAMSNFTLTCYREAMEIYREAARLDPNNSYAHYAIGKILGRLRRSVHGPVCKASEDELGSFKRAIKLWGSNPFYIVFYALALSSELVKDDILDFTTVDTMDNLLQYALKAAETNEMFQESASVYKWCEKGYKYICMARSNSGRLTKKQYGDFLRIRKTCIDKAVELSPNNSGTLTEAGLFYWRQRFYTDNEKAEAFLRKAAEVHVYECNVWADINLVQFCKETKQEYNPVEAYCALKVKYQDTQYQGLIHERLGIEYEHQGKCENARREYFSALTCLEDNSNIQLAPKNLLPLLQKFVAESTEKFNNDPAYFSKHIQDLFEAAKMYLAFSPKRLFEAQELYQTILNNDSERENEVRKALVKILLERELYDQCIQGCQEIQAEKTFKDRILAEAYFHKANAAPEYSDFCKFQQLNATLNRNTPPLFPLKPNQCKVNLPENVLLYFLSAECGRLDSASRFIELVISKVLAEHQHYKESTEIYEKFALLQNIFKDERKIASQIEAALELNRKSPLCLVRQARYEMFLSWCHHPISAVAMKCNTTLQESRSVLDRTVYQFRKANYGMSKPKPRCYFPYYYPGNSSTIPGFKQKFEKGKSEKHVNKKMSDSLDIPSFKADYPDLCTFLAYRTPIYDQAYDFLPEFFNQVNRHKHEADITSQKNTQKLAELYELAHKAAEFTEDVVSKFYEYM